MDDLRFWVPFKSVSVISGMWVGDNERLCAMEPRVRLKRSSTHAGFEPGIARSAGQRNPLSIQCYTLKCFGDIGHSDFLTPGAPVVQWVKRWLTDLAVPSSIPARGEFFFNRERSSTTNTFSLSTSNRPDMTEILLKSM